jgi:Ankyrin repeats (3 copies)
MTDPDLLDSLFCAAVSAIDAGDVATLEQLLTRHPRLLRDRLDSPGAWLRDKVGGALEDFFEQPARHLVERGEKLTLATALCLGYRDAAARLAQTSSARHRQFSFVLAALNGKAEALAALLDLGVDLNAPSPDLYSHATPVHHAVWSGSLESVKVLVEAGAALDRRDTVYGGTPLGWAEHGKHDEIAAYLRESLQLE